jgi:PAS domain S-box-containing protein
MDGALGVAGVGLDPRTALSLFDLSPNPYVVLTPELRIAAANQAYLRITGGVLNEIVGRDLFEAFPSEPGHQALVRQSLERALEAKKPDHLALIRYDMPRDVAGGTVMDERYWSATHTPLLDADGEVRLILQHTQDVTELHRLRQVAQAAESGGVEHIGAALFQRAQQVQRTNEELSAGRRRLHELFRQAPGFICVLSGPDHVFEFINVAYERLIGRSDVTGKPLAAALPEVAEQGFVELLDRVTATREPFVGHNVEVYLQAPGEAPKQVVLDFIYQPIIETDGRVSGIFVEGYDVTEQRAFERALQESEGRLRLMLDELNHRVKNTIATVQSIAAQTSQTSASMKEFVQAFNARLIALSHTHNALTRRNWTGADLREILEPEVRPYSPDRVLLEGPAVELSPRAAVTLGMCFHELATNAAKYGALSGPTGQIVVRWRQEARDGAAVLVIDWSERDGPPVSPPTRRGFGSKLIQRSVTGELHGAAELQFLPEGLQCHVTLPLDRRA